MSYTAIDARREFTPLLRRGTLTLLGARLGLTSHTVRVLIDTGTIPAIRYGSHNTRAYYELESALGAMLPTTTK